MPTIAEKKKAALAAANDVRRQLGKPPVDHLYKGNRNKADSCPITNTIYDDDLDREAYEVTTREEWIIVRARGLHFPALAYYPVPPESRVHQFISSFDHGRYPELESE